MKVGELTVNVNVAFANEAAMNAFTRVAAKVAHAKTLRDTIKPSELIGDLQVAADGLTTVNECRGAYRYRDHSFATAREMRLFEQKMKDGFWYDWRDGESNDPNWSRIANGCEIFDAETGENITHVEFYHAGSHYVERIARNGKWSVASLGTLDRSTADGCEAKIHECRELTIREKTA